MDFPNYNTLMFLSKQNVEEGEGDVKRSKENIFTEVTSHLDHQLEGVRFLYRLYIKKKPAAILNDPAGYGKRLQAITFLNAVQSRLKKPTLVLCHEEKLSKWKHEFHKWGKFENDVVTDIKTSFVKNKVYISDISNVHLLTRNEWSVLVLNFDDIPGNLNRVQIRADFKIFVTSIALTKALDLLTRICNWLKLDLTVDLKQFDPNCKPNEVLNKFIQLDAILEDVLLRRNCVDTPFKTEEYINIKTPVKTRKNKDATGTKIKRSKRQIQDDSNYDTENKVSTLSVTNTANNNIEVNREELVETTNMDIETFIRDRKPLTAEGFTDYMDDTERNNSAKEINYTQPDTNNELVTQNDSPADVNGREGNNDNHNYEIGDDMCGKLRETNNSAKETNYTGLNDLVISENFCVNANRSKDNVDCHDNVEEKADVDVTDSSRSNDIKEADNVSLVGENDKVDAPRNNNGKGHKDLDTRLRELEEKTMKKFKGSLLDRIF